MKDIDLIIEEQYLKRGFGSMTKNDFEVWIFNHLLENKLKNKSNYDISIELRIPESKVKRLKYEASLKYTLADYNSYNDEFEKILSKSVLKKNGMRIQFVMEDIQLRKYVDSILKREGFFTDTSFNSEIVSMDIDTLAFLLDNIISPKKKEEIITKANYRLGKNIISFKELLNEFLKSVVKETGKRMIDLSTVGLLTLLK